MEKQFIAISTDSNTSQLQNLAELLRQKYGFNSNPILLQAENAQQERLQKALEKLSHETYDKDTLVLYVSCKSFVQAQEGYWIPYEVAGDAYSDTFISQTLVFNLLKDINARQTLVISESYLQPQVYSQSIWCLSPDWKGIPQNPIPAINLRLNIYTRLKDNELEYYKCSNFVDGINQYKDKKNIEIIHKAGEVTSPPFEWVQKVSEPLLLSNVQKADAGVNNELKLQCYDRYIEFCKTNAPKDRKRLDEILFKKGVLTGKISQTATIEAKDAYIMQTYKEIDELKQLAHEKQQEIDLLKAEKAFLKQKLERQKRIMQGFALIGILLLVMGIAYYSSKPKTVVGLGLNEGEKLIREKIGAFNTTLQALQMKDDAFTDHQKSLLRYFTAVNNQVCHVKAGKVLDTMSVSDYLQKGLNAQEAWVIEKIEKQEATASETMTEFQIRIKETNTQGRKILGVACSKDSFDNYVVRFTDLRLVQK